MNEQPKLKGTFKDNAPVTDVDRTILGKMDWVLNCIQFISSWDNTCEAATISSEAESKKLHFNKIELGSILKTLVEDGYVNHKPEKVFIPVFPDGGTATGVKNNEEYSITYKGLLFKENGGYKGKFKQDNQAKDHAEKVEKAMLVNNMWMSVWALLAGLSTVGLLTMEVLKYCDDISYFWFYLIAIMIVIAISSFFIREKLKQIDEK